MGGLTPSLTDTTVPPQALSGRGRAKGPLMHPSPGGLLEGQDVADREESVEVKKGGWESLMRRTNL
ncbi:MAG: hypothetical protein QXS54_08985, partial [Candidatus Methanomethylicaceae archaeon]